MLWAPALCLLAQMYREIAEQKAEKEARAKEMQPRERDYAKEHAESVSSIRQDAVSYCSLLFGKF